MTGSACRRTKSKTFLDFKYFPASPSEYAESRLPKKMQRREILRLEFQNNINMLNIRCKYLGHSDPPPPAGGWRKSVDPDFIIQ